MLKHSMVAPPQRARLYNLEAMERKAAAGNYASEAPGYVYVITEAKPSADILAVKIGRTKRSVSERFHEIQGEARHDLRLIYAVRTSCNVLLERLVHELLKL